LVGYYNGNRAYSLWKLGQSK